MRLSKNFLDVNWPRLIMRVFAAHDQWLQKDLGVGVEICGVEVKGL